MSAATFDHRLLVTCKFAVIEPSMIRLLPEGASVSRMVPHAFAATAHLMPALLSVDELGPTQRAHLLQAIDDVQIKGAAPLVAFFVRTHAAHEEFLGHWNLLQVRRSPNTPAWLRLHDPRVFHQLLRVLTPPQQATVFGSSTALTYSLGGEWLTVERPDGPAAMAAFWDWERIERIGLVNRALGRARVRSPAALTAQGAKAERLIERAVASHGLTHADDLVEFAYRGLTCGDDFDKHPEIKAKLSSEGPTDDSFLADRLALIEPETWLAAKSPQANSKRESATHDRQEKV
jgi:Domain of unknown function (DUF4123)